MTAAEDSRAGEVDAANRRIAEELIALAPPGWHELRAVFALTTGTELASVFFADEEGHPAQVLPTEEVLELVRRQRAASAALPGGPWWRCLVLATASGEVAVDHDFGAEPFPDDHLFPPEAYRADLETFPRARLPVWLGAYLGHGDRQSRPAERPGDPGGTTPAVETTLPALPLLAMRWAAIAAAFTAAGSPFGPRVLPALGLFEGAERSGSSLWLVPGDRAVLSGGVWDDPVLDAVYNAGAPMPDLYAGAPPWVANPLLNPRAGEGLLSFCYWWEAGRWYRGASPPASEAAAAVPAVWSRESAAEVIAALAAEGGVGARDAALELVVAAEHGQAGRPLLVRLFGETGEVDGGLLQLLMAGAAE
ncbi:hypothetical protein AB0H71_03990 [Nocardia sp. NPDC050697]|uniref:hypothetical protein n=1 Tax=Nocardia sp. NPDC050697 TaxID=3155158 RepID=UPI0033D67DEB